MTLVSRYSNRYFLSLEGSILRSRPVSFFFDPIDPMRTIPYKDRFFFEKFGFSGRNALLCVRMERMIIVCACLCYTGLTDR